MVSNTIIDFYWWLDYNVYIHVHVWEERCVHVQCTCTCINFNIHFNVIIHAVSMICVDPLIVSTPIPADDVSLSSSSMSIVSADICE